MLCGDQLEYCWFLGLIVLGPMVVDENALNLVTILLYRTKVRNAKSSHEGALEEQGSALFRRLPDVLVYAGTAKTSAGLLAAKRTAIT